MLHLRFKTWEDRKDFFYKKIAEIETSNELYEKPKLRSRSGIKPEINEEFKEIRKLYDEGLSVKDLAKKLNRSTDYVRRRLSFIERR